MSEDPIRWLDPGSDAPEGLRDALEAAREELPSEAQLASLAARLGPLLAPPPGGGGASSGGAPPGLGPAAGGLGGGALAAAAGAVAIVGAVVAGVTLRHAPAPGRGAGDEAAAARAAVADAATPPAEPELPTGVDPPPAEPATPPAARDRPRGPRPRLREPPPAADPAAELGLIREAQRALRSDPSRALALAREHRARFPDGALAQEREVLAIDALARSGRTDEARRRAAAFRRRWPRSAHRRRIDVILERAP